MYTYSVFLPHFFIWFRCKASILTRNIFFLLMSQSLFSRSAQKRTSTPGKERSGNHDFKQFNWVKAQNSNDPCDANSPGFQKEVRWNGDYGGFGQCWHVSTGWAGHIWQGFPSHTLWLSSPVSSSNYCCHPQRLHLSLTAAHYLQSKKKKKKCELNQTSLFPLANLVPYVIKQAWRSGDETLCLFFFLLQH